MAEKASEAGAPPQTPLTDDDLAEIERSWSPAYRVDSVTAHEVYKLTAEVRRLRARVAELEADRRRLEDAAMEVHGTTRCRYMEPMWEGYTARPCLDCMDAAARMAAKADGWTDAELDGSALAARPK
jgi:hypothetical protein